MNNLPLSLLKETLQKARKLKLNADFIELIEAEIKSRQSVTGQCR